jgi:thiamine-monophosphate kinase
VLQGQLNLSSEENAKCIDALQRPEPRVSLGLALRNLAHSAIDISDGLLADLGHILEKSKLGAKLDWEAIPKFHASHTIDEQILKSVTLAGGDDYELCFTAPSSAYDEIKKIGARLNLSLSRIGTTDNSGKIQVLDQHQNDIYIERTGYDHFN